MTIFRAPLPLLFLRGAGRRRLLTVLAIAIAAAAVVATDLVNRGVARAFSEVLDAMAGRAALRVWADGATFPTRFVERIAQVPGVRTAAPSLVIAAFADEDMLTIHGLELSRGEVLHIYEPSGSGALEVDAFRVAKERRPILLPRALAARRGLGIGGVITLETPAGREPFVVAGLIGRGEMVRLLGESVALVPLHVLQEVVARAGLVNRIDIVAQPDADIAALAGAISAVLPRGPRVITPAQRAMDFHRVTRSLGVILWTVVALGLVLSFVIAFGCLAGEFEWRAWELGVMRAVGIRAADVRWMLLVESLLLGLAGIALGLPLGIAIGKAALPSINSAAASSALASPLAELAVRPASLALGAAVALLAVVIAAALPAHRAARVAIAETMRGRGIEQTGPRRAGSWMALGPIAAGAALAVLMQWRTGTAAWGFVATALGAIAAALAAKPLLALVAGPLVNLLAAAGPAGILTGTTALRRPRRAALVVSVAAIGLGCIVWLSTVARSFEQSLLDTLTGTLGADLFVTSAHTTSGWIPAPLGGEILDELRGVDGVADVAGNRVATWRFGEREIVINTFDGRYFGDERFGRSRLVGPRRPDAYAAVARGEGAIVSTNFAHHFGVAAGDTIALETPAGRLALRVVGTTMAFMAPGGTIEMSRELYRRMWQDDQMNRVWVRTAPGADPGVVRAAIASRLGTRHRVAVFSSGEMREHLLMHVRRAFAPIAVVVGIVLLVLLIGLSDVLAAGVAQRTRELGMARAVGVPQRTLARMVLIEGAVLGGLGLLLATVLGLGLGMLWVTITLPNLLGWTLEPHVPLARLVVLGGLTLLVGLLAGWLPARRAAALQPAAALRHD